MSTKKSITQLLSAGKESISYNDLFLGTIQNSYNYNLNAKSLVDFFRDYSTSLFPIQFNNTFLNFNNTNSSVYLSDKIKGEIESFTFDNYGNIIKITPKQNKVNVIDMYSGSIANATGNGVSRRRGLGYFNNVTPVQANGEKIYTAAAVMYFNNQSYTLEKGNWGLLFDQPYNFKKTIVTYRHGRNDASGSSEAVSNFKFIIFWDGENITRLSGTAQIGTNQSNNQTASYIWKNQIVADNTNIYPTPSVKALPTNFYDDYNKDMVLQLDGKNKIIKKLPIPVRVPNSNRQTHAMSVTIESFA